MINRTRKPDNSPLDRRQAGLSLIELMISLTIGLVLLAGITTLISRQSSTRSEMEKSSRQIENGRYALQLLHDDIEHAGFYGEYMPPAGTTYTTPDPCNTDIALDNFGWATTPTVPVPAYGYAGAATAPLACLSNYQPNTAVLVVRRMATATVATAAANTAYLQISQCSTSSTPFAFGTTASTSFSLLKKDCTTTAPLYPYIVRTYYVSSCDVCGAGGDTIPTLKVVEFTNGAQTTLPLVEGIENLQFDYGIAASATSASPANYTTAPAAADWANVMAVRVNLLARNNEPTVGYSDTKTYTLGGASAVTPGGAYKRHEYNQVVRLINPNGRREQ